MHPPTLQLEAEYYPTENEFSVTTSASAVNEDEGVSTYTLSRTIFYLVNHFWSSSNENVATVDQNGNVTFKGVGETTITVITTHRVYLKEVYSIRTWTVNVYASYDEKHTIINNIINCSNLIIPDNRKNIAEALTETMLQYDYPIAFIAGMIANIIHEGELGQFESSNYSNPLNKPDYLTYMDSNYNGENYYLNNYSGKNIMDVNVIDVYNMLNDLKTISLDTWRINGSRVGFGLGCIQWTFKRTYTLVELYLEKNNNSSVITEKQLIDSETTMIIRELSSSMYKNIFSNWKNSCNETASVSAANLAGMELCSKYLVPYDLENQKVKRGLLAEKIFEVMVG